MHSCKWFPRYRILQWTKRVIWEKWQIKPLLCHSTKLIILHHLKNVNYPGWHGWSLIPYLSEWCLQIWIYKEFSNCPRLCIWWAYIIIIRHSSKIKSYYFGPFYAPPPSCHSKSCFEGPHTLCKHELTLGHQAILDFSGTHLPLVGVIRLVW